MFLLGILVLTVDVLAVADDEDNHEYYLVIRVDPGDFSEFAVNMEDATELFGEKDIEAGTETVFNRIAIYNHSIPLSPLYCKVVLYRDTGSVNPGSGPILGSVSVSEIHILGIAYAKDTFSLY